MDGTITYLQSGNQDGRNFLSPVEEQIITNVLGPKGKRPIDVQEKNYEQLRERVYTNTRPFEPKPIEDIDERRGAGPAAVIGPAIAAAAPIILPMVIEGMKAFMKTRDGRGVYAPNFRGSGVDRTIQEFLGGNSKRLMNMDASLLNLKPYAFYKRLGKYLAREMVTVLREVCPNVSEEVVDRMAAKAVTNLIPKHVFKYISNKTDKKYSGKGTAYGWGDYGRVLVEGAISKHLGHIPPEIKRAIKHAAGVHGGSKFVDKLKTGWSKIKGVAGRIWEEIGPIVKEVAPKMAPAILNSLQKRAGIEDSELTDSLKEMTTGIVSDLSADKSVKETARRNVKKALPAVLDKIGSKIDGEDELKSVTKNVIMDTVDGLTSDKKGEGIKKSRRKVTGEGFTLTLL